MSSLNFPSGASVNQPEMILSLINEMDKYGVQPEIECFDTGMLNYTNYLISKNILKSPHHINIILGNIYNGQCDFGTLSTIKNNLPTNSFTCLGGIGSQQLKSMTYGLLDFDGIGDVVIDKSLNDGLSDVFVPANSDGEFSEYQFTANDLGQFTGFSIKIIMTGTNESYPLRFKDIRVIALQ